MDVDRYTFPRSVLDIIEAIADADFVAVDFEFSGVAANAPRSTGRVKDTLQDRYTQLRAAAAKYTILQAGICCARRDEKTSDWKLQAYNIPISPVVNEELEIQRDFAFQSGAVQFLVRNGFDFGVSLSRGVQYLSCAEEAAALAALEKRDDRSQVQDILLGEHDTEAVAFMQQVRQKITLWLEKRNNSKSSSAQQSLDLMHRVDSTTGAHRELSSYDRRLVHQLVRSEFPQLVSIGRGQEMTIRVLNREREAQHRALRLERARALVRRHVGFRRVVDALAGGDIGDAADYEALREATQASSPYSDLDASEDDDDPASLRAQYERVTAKLRTKRGAVLVGHNIINDLVYLHQAFLSPLPERVADFAASIHAHFPLVFDTKYLVTHDSAAMNPASSLARVDEQLALEALSLGKLSLGTTSEAARSAAAVAIRSEAGFDKYAEAQSLHEAGYDAFVTARVFVRMAAKLSDDANIEPFDDQHWSAYSNRCRVFGTHETLLHLQACDSADRDGGVSIV